MIIDPYYDHIKCNHASIYEIVYNIKLSDAQKLHNWLCQLWPEINKKYDINKKELSCIKIAHDGEINYKNSNLDFFGYINPYLYPELYQQRKINKCLIINSNNVQEIKKKYIERTNVFGLRPLIIQ